MSTNELRGALAAAYDARGAAETDAEWLAANLEYHRVRREVLASPAGFLGSSEADPVVGGILANGHVRTFGCDLDRGAVPADFSPTTSELALLLRVRDGGGVEVDEASEMVYARLLWLGALRVDAGPTMRYVPYANFYAALCADGSGS